MHRRKEIRDMLVELLKGKTSCGGNVFSNRGRKFFSSELPSITVYTETESASFFNSPENILKRSLPIVVECAILQNDHPDDEIDSLCAEIENALPSRASPDLARYGSIVQSFRLSQTEIGMIDRGEKMLCTARMTFECEYDTDA